MSYEFKQKPIEVLDISIQGIEPIKSNAPDFKARLGRFTGSEIDKLMGCSTSTSKMLWDRPEKILDFSDTALKYVYSKAKERQRGKVIKRSSSYAMQYGSNQEAKVKEMLGYSIDDCGFIEFIEGVAGSTPDGWIASEKMGLEVKCATDWDTLFLRHETDMTPKHQDFWQLQTEMLSLKCDKMLYVIAEPSEDMFEPNITDLAMTVVEASEVHQKAIIARCKIANEAISLFLGGLKLRDAVNQAACEFNV